MSEAGFQEFLEILRSGDAEAVDRLLSDFDPFSGGPFDCDFSTVEFAESSTPRTSCNRC